MLLIGRIWWKQWFMNSETNLLNPTFPKFEHRILVLHRPSISTLWKILLSIHRGSWDVNNSFAQNLQFLDEETQPPRRQWPFQCCLQTCCFIHSFVPFMHIRCSVGICSCRALCPACRHRVTQPWPPSSKTSWSSGVQPTDGGPEIRIQGSSPPTPSFLTHYPGDNFSKSQTLATLTFSPISSTSNTGLAKCCFSVNKKL